QELRTAAGRVDIKLNTRVERIERDSVGAARYALTLADGSVVHADAVIVATPAHIAARLLEHSAPDVAQPLAQVSHVSTATVTLAYPEGAVQRPLDAT